MALMAMFLGCLEYVLEEGPHWDWSGDDTIRATAWISGLSGAAFLWRSLTFARPVVDLRALKSRNFAPGCFFSFVTGIGIFSAIYLTPLFLGRVRGFSAMRIGLTVFSTGRFQVLAIPFYVPRPQDRLALADDVRPGVLHLQHVEQAVRQASIASA